MPSKISNNLKGWFDRFGDRLADMLSGRTGTKFGGPPAFGVAAVFGVIALGLSGWIVWSSIQRLGRPQPLPNANTSQIAELAVLQTKDTDEDGLSDYDELFRLKTSPYLKDSDSDGIDDADEISQGGDPNCPAGKSCTGTTTVSAGAGSLTPEFLRQALREAGVAQSVLDGLADDELLEIYQSVVQSGGSTNASNANVSVTLGTLQGLSGAEVREIFLQAGVSQEELNQIDDATLKQIFEQAIQSGNTQ